ncbi:MAG: endolytic transglycosylase MltG [Patescibacteria group bacterium]|jgi:UPF0755 protein
MKTRKILIWGAWLILACLLVSLLMPRPVKSLVRMIIPRKPAPPAEIVYAPEIEIRLIEGWSLRDVAQYLELQGLFSQEEFYQFTGEPLQNRIVEEGDEDWLLGFDFFQDLPKSVNLEGFIFPDTYRVFASSSPQEVLTRILKNFDQKLSPEMRQAIKDQGRSLYEVISLASMVEKEAPINYRTGDNQDARLIAGVFMNRLRIGQGLQSDATLSYLFNDTKPAHSGAELEIDSAYNTYKYRGLPPGPIANPGLVAIEAAIWPAKTDYFYFLTPSDQAIVVYAKTYEEHLANKRKYLK